MNTAAELISISAAMNHSVVSADDMSDGVPSSPESPSFDEADLLSSGITDDVTAQLAAAGPVGVAAAAAIASAKKRKRPHTFETNPSIRKRQQTRLLRKLKVTIDEYATRVGQQAVVLICTPGKPQNSYKVFGAKPLEDVIRSCRNVIMQELEQALAQQAPPPPQEDPTLHELPPLVIDGIPTPVEKMTQAQLRAFIPLMLKYATGRGKPGWGKESTRPPWWPEDLPWANVRSDVRSEEEKQRVSWTHALRQIVINCYKYHGREDLLPAFSEDDDKEKVKSQIHVAQYTPTVLQTINNPDGTMSIIHVDPTNAVVTLPDGTQAQVQAVSTLSDERCFQIQSSHSEATQAVQTLAEVAASVTDGSGTISVDLNSEAAAQAVATLAEATLNSDGQIILTGEDGTQGREGSWCRAFPVSGMVTIPVSMYQTVVTSMAQLSGQADGQAGMQVAMAPVVTDGTQDDQIEVLTVTADPTHTAQVAQ